MYQSHHFLSCGKKIYAKNHFKADTVGVHQQSSHQDLTREFFVF
jgi:hypothetical protein